MFVKIKCIIKTLLGFSFKKTNIECVYRQQMSPVCLSVESLKYIVEIEHWTFI